MDSMQSGTSSHASREPVSGPSNPLQVRCDEGFADWLKASGGSLAISTYQAGLVVLVGWDASASGGAGGITILPRRFDKPMGIAIDQADPSLPARLALATRRAIWSFANSEILAQEYRQNDLGRYDALFLPRVVHHTNDLFPHDLAFGADGEIWVVNTRFGCLATLSDRYGFQPRWKPPFLSQLAPEDRCHLNGLAMTDGRPSHVTALGETDTPGGWRADRIRGGVVIDVASGETIVRGLSMPHSPRVHDGRLEVLNSGTGEYGFADRSSGRFEVIAALPGYLRGLCAVGNVALVGLCKIREQHIFGGLPVEARWPSLVCGVKLVDRTSGAVIGELEFLTGCEEIFELRFLAQMRRPNLLNLERAEVFDAFPVPPPHSSYWLRPSNVVAE